MGGAMKASVVDLRHRMKEVLQALRRDEEVQILYHGKLAGTIVPPRTAKPAMRAQDHPFFGSAKGSHRRGSVERIVDKLRAPRYSW